jgi:hypothetical protein
MVIIMWLTVISSLMQEVLESKKQIIFIVITTISKIQEAQMGLLMLMQ